MVNNLVDESTSTVSTNEVINNTLIMNIIFSTIPRVLVQDWVINHLKIGFYGLIEEKINLNKKVTEVTNNLQNVTKVTKRSIGYAVHNIPQKVTDFDEIILKECVILLKSLNHELPDYVLQYFIENNIPLEN